MKSSKIIFFIILTLFLMLQLFTFITSPSFRVSNNTGFNISYNSLQYIDTGEEPTTEELDYWRLKYTIKTSKSKVVRIRLNKRFIDEKLYFGMDFKYNDTYLTAENKSDLQGVTFSDEPSFKNHIALLKWKFTQIEKLS